MSRKGIFIGFIYLMCASLSFAAVPPEERAALVALYYNTDGDNWGYSANWLIGDPCENNWSGVYCDNGNTTVQSLDLGMNILDGSIPPNLGNLSNLQELCLFDGELSGSIPTELGNLSNLIKLWLDNNQLSGSIPSELGNLSNLQELYLNDNLLDGSIPTELSTLSNLIRLWLDDNQLSGSIPSELGSLSNLQELYLDDNMLDGSIPSELGNLSDLQELYLNDNLLDGSIPSELGNLYNLLSLHLQWNNLSGSIPTELGNLSNLRSFGLLYNHLSGSIPSEFGNLSNLRSIGLSSLPLSGSIPIQLLNLTFLEYHMSDFRYNAIFTDDDTLRAFLNSTQWGGDWESTQTIAPENLSVINCPLSSSIMLYWDPILYTDDTGGYEVYYSDIQGGPYTYYDITPDKLISSMIVNGLTTGQVYFFIIKTVTYSHSDNPNTVVSEDSEEVSGIPQLADPLLLVSKSGNDVKFDWNSCGILPFNIRYAISPSGAFSDVPGGGNFPPAYHVGALIDGIDYYYRFY